MITFDKQKLINLIQSFIVQGADDHINLGHTLSPEEYTESIELQLKQIEIVLHNELDIACSCDMCNFNNDNSNYAELQVDSSCR